MTRKLGIVVLVSIALGAIMWHQLGTATHAQKCCGLNCWAVDDDGEALNPDDAYCEQVTIDRLPESEASTP